MIVGIIASIVAYIPAMIANSLAVVFGGRYIIDGGRCLAGKRILGDGKTWSGLIGGTVSAFFVGMILAFILNPYLEMYGFPTPGIYIILTLAFGALLGDICGSLFKRRLGKERGANMFFLDQYDFVIGSFILTFTLFHEWAKDSYLTGDRWIALILIIMLTPLLHRGVNIIGYNLGLKKEPW